MGEKEVKMGYTKQTWQTGEVITAEKLNHIEDGIAAGGDSDVSTADLTIDNSANGAAFTLYVPCVVSEGGETITTSSAYVESYSTIVCKVFIYKGTATIAYEDNDTPSDITIEGDISYEDDLYFITGDCKMTIADQSKSNQLPFYISPFKGRSKGRSFIVCYRCVTIIF